MTITSKSLYNDSLTLLIDFYQLSMAYSWWQNGYKDVKAVFHLFFRKQPFDGGYAISCGLNQFIEVINSWDIHLGQMLEIAQMKPELQNAVEDNQFIDFLKSLKKLITIKAVSDGTVIFRTEPIIQVSGPIILGQLLESIALNIFGYQTLIATKASRIKYAAENDKVLEFGLRRAQGFDGAISASYAAFIGGCDATSNTLASLKFKIPLEGTCAHSFVMSFESEIEAFKAYASTYSNNIILLVDTYNTLRAVKEIIANYQWFQDNNITLTGIRLDSGDLAYLSIEARKLLDSANLQSIKIIASNDLDEHIIYSLKQQKAKIDAWGVGTKLVTAYDQPSLGCVYKLSAISKDSTNWQYKLKLSEQASKISDPGVLNIRRFKNNTTNYFVADMIYDQNIMASQPEYIIDPTDFTRRRKINNATEAAFDLHENIFINGHQVYEPKSILETKEYCQNQIKSLHDTNKRLLNPHNYPVGLEENLFNLKTKLILEARGQ